MDVHGTPASGVAAVREQLAAGESVATLLVEATRHVVESCGYGRGLALLAVEGTLHASDKAVRDRPSDRLRRLVRAQPPTLTPDSFEAEALRRESGARRGARPSQLEGLLELDGPAFAAIRVDGVGVGLLVGDLLQGASPAPSQAALQLLAQIAGDAWAAVILRQRLRGLGQTVRQLTGAADVAIAEAVSSHPFDFDAAALQTALPADTADLDAAVRLSPRQREVAEGLARGLTYEQLAEELFLSPSTVRAHASALRRRLGARGRADTVARVAGSLASPRANG
jgi:DNA-binding CsgD family transcriptional regulator